MRKELRNRLKSLKLRSAARSWARSALMMDHTEVSVEASEATSKSAYFASQAKSTESKEWANELVQDGDRKARAVKRSETFKADQRFFHDTHGEGSVVSRTADGVVEMKFDNGEVHKYDLISQRKLRPIIEDAHTYTAEVLFDIVDTDSSGVLEKAEFVYMHTMVLNSEKRAAAKIADAERNEAEQRRAKRMVMWALLVAVLMILVLLGAMVGISLAANEASKESHVSNGGLMTALDGSAVKTEVARSFGSLFDLPLLNTTALATLELITVRLAAEDPSGKWPAAMDATLKVTSALKPSDDEVYLLLASGAVAHIDAKSTTGRVELADGAAFSVVVDEEAEKARRRSRRHLQFGGGNFGGAVLTTNGFTMTTATGGF